MSFLAENAHCLFLVLGGVITGPMLGCGSPAYSIPDGSNRDNQASHTGGVTNTARSDNTIRYGSNPYGTDPYGTDPNGTRLYGTGGYTNSAFSSSTGSAGYVAAGTTQRESGATGGNSQLIPSSNATEPTADAGVQVDCDALCMLPHATADCGNGICTVGRCNDGWGDCNALAVDGCEVNLRADPEHCGNCDSNCSTANGTANCKSGECGITCATGYADCDATLANGCETNLMIAVKNCGECGTVCQDATNGTAVCRAGDCALSNCTAPYGDCDNNSSNGCESNAETDVMNCGGCGQACSLPHAAATCANRACAILTCEEGWADCNGLDIDGCEVQLTSSPSHCGACNAVCAPEHATGACVRGECKVDTCETDRDDCNHSAKDGCEIDLKSSVSNCGACGVTCSATHGTPSCTKGTCAIACTSGYGNCDGNADNGCEIETATNLKHCGGCNQPCAGQCNAGSCITSPCSGYCENPIVFTPGGGAITDIAKKICHVSYEATQPFVTGNCGQFDAAHKLYINDLGISCSGSMNYWNFSAATRPAARYGGYCFHDDKAGANGNYAWFDTW